jgi:hypothetical protein
MTKKKAPPREWFETSEPPGLMPLTVTDDGRVFGHVAAWNTCHTAFAACRTPPRSNTSYGYFHTGELETREGAKLSVGKIMVGGPHAPLEDSLVAATAFYDRTSSVGAYVKALNGRHGVWVAGSVCPDVDADGLRRLRANPPSGDWRPVNGALEMVAVLAVPVPGFPVQRTEIAMVASADGGQVQALVASAAAFEPSRRVISTLVAAGCGIDPPPPLRRPEVLQPLTASASLAKRPPARSVRDDRVGWQCLFQNHDWIGGRR